MEELEQIIKECILESRNGKESFFEMFYNKHGKGYFFLFKKNLRVTNIQFAELVALIKLFASSTKDSKINTKLQFFTKHQFDSAFNELLNSFLLDIDENKDMKEEIDLAITEFSKQYVKLLKHGVIIDAFHTSCSVFLPPFSYLDLQKMCAMSGYIHSCGYHIYVRNINKFKPGDFFKIINNNLSSNNVKKGKKIFFTIYSHEDFSLYDIEKKEDLMNGLEDTKIYEEKFYIGRNALVTFIKDLRTKTADRLHVPERGNYQRHRDVIENPENNIERGRTYWLMLDKSINPNFIQYPGSDSYYICYEQIYINKNQLHIFDENKLGWKSSTTLPHTLCGAMLNITMANKNLQSTVEVCDPFAGSGTTFFETLKFEKINFHGGELDFLCADIARLNLDFFSFDLDELKRFREHLREINSFADTQRNPNNPLNSELKDFNKRLQTILKLFPEVDKGEFIFDKGPCDHIEKLDVREKILFYLVLRIKLLYKNTFIRMNKNPIKLDEDFFNAMYKVSSKFKIQCERYFNQLHEAFGNEAYKCNTEQQYNTHKWTDTYSYATSIHPCAFQNKRKDFERINNFGKDGDVLKLEPNKYDIIITDPPYGFNTDEQIFELSRFYQDFITKLILGLKENGQLIMALPEKSFSGKISPYFTHKEIVTQLILNICNDHGFDLYSHANTLPNEIMFRPPYYWESEKALSRSIVHFQIKKGIVDKKEDSQS